MAERDLIEAIREGLPPGIELDQREEALLDLAARQFADVEAAEAAEPGQVRLGCRSAPRSRVPTSVTTMISSSSPRLPAPPRRVCATPGCIPRLSRYNGGPLCWCCADRRSGRAGR
jgi:hypothetical protein